MTSDTLLGKFERLNELAFYNFETRPDQPERNDQQTAFYNSQHEGPTFLLGGNGCIAAEQEIYDPQLGISRRIDSIDGQFHVWSIDRSGNRIIAEAEQPRICGREKLYEVTLVDGRAFRVTLDHRLMDASGNWRTVREFIRGEDHYSINLKSTEPECHEPVQSWMFVDSAEESRPKAAFTCPSGIRQIIDVRFIREDVYWDFHVPVHENYWMEGVWHHNSGTTTCGLAKMVKFCFFDQPPPRRDTPFWVISSSYQICMNACWKEKLHQMGHICPNDIEWNRISWYKPNQDWPFSVPLKPWPGRPGKNWLLCFKSYDQGQAAMMAESIGGFLFVEQFPWALLNEVMRGCREYSFTGNKLVEFTPVDPALSMPLREMEDKGTLPASWGLYRANTKCAVEAGQVSASWYRDFFAMIPESMLAVREQGLWGNFEGAIYPEYSANIHCVDKDFVVPPGWYHRRGIDFGFSLDHAFCCLFGALSPTGVWVIYGEYFSTDSTRSVIDHWKIIADMEHWPENSPYYGTTYVDHDLDAVRTLSKINEYTKSEEYPDGEYDPPQMQLAKKAVHEGIETIRMLLKPTLRIDPAKPLQPRLLIVKENCPNLCRELISYRWMKKLSTGVNSQAPKDEPVKDDDHAVDALRMMIFTEMSNIGMTPNTLARQHSAPEGMQLDSKKFRQRREKQPSR